MINSDRYAGEISFGRFYQKHIIVGHFNLTLDARSDSTIQEYTGFKITLDKLDVRSMHIVGDSLVVDVDGVLSVK